MRKESNFTKIGWYLVVISIITQLLLSFTYITSNVVSEKTFGQLTVIESILGFTGLLMTDILKNEDFTIPPKKYKRLDGNTVFYTIIIIFGIEVVQFLAQLPLTVKDYQKALAIAFAGPVEEAFFRGFLISSFVLLEKSIIKPKKRKDSKWDNITLLGVVGVFTSSFAFAFLHINYYNNVSYMLAVFLSGIVLGFAYLLTNDLTACILAHFIVNILVVIQTFYLPTF